MIALVIQGEVYDGINRVCTMTHLTSEVLDYSTNNFKNYLEEEMIESYV